MEREVFSRLAQLENDHWWFVARRKIISEFLHRLTAKSKDKRILEVGCGTGGNLRMLSRYGAVSAFEPDDESRDFAVRQGNIPVQSGALPKSIPYEGEMFDLVVALDVLEHVEKDEESLKALAERLEPEGSLFITVPALRSLWSEHDERHHHYRRYTKSKLSKVLEDAGYRIVTISYFNTLLFPFIAGIRHMKKLFRMHDADDEVMPPRWLNKLLERIFSAERYLLGRIPLPIGVSLIVVAQKVTP